ncbi:MAG: EamA family transporter [Saprospiraceae bacterium]|nr:EamA family transporter [Saprospiraceae bacterium]
MYIIWGSTYLFNKILVAELPPFLLAGIRFVSAAILIFLFALLTGKIKKNSKKQLINSAIAGFLFLTVGNGCAVWALQYIDSGFTALLISTQPLILIFMLYFLEQRPILPKSIVGVILGMVGIYLLVNQETIGLTTDKIQGIGAIFIALLCWGYGSIFVSKADLPKGSFVNTGYQMLFGGLMMIVISLILQEPFSTLQDISSKAIYSMLYLVIFGSIIAFTSFNFLLLTVSPEKVATSTYINPIVAMFLGWWVLNEIISVQSIIAAVILLTGVYFINSSKSKSLKD